MRFSWPLFAKEMREARWKWAIGGALLLLTAISLPLLFPYLEQIMEGVDLPGPWGSALDAQMRDYGAYIWFNWYGKNLFQFLLVLAAVLGASSVSGERARGSWELLLCQPLSRAEIFFSKYAAGLVLLLAVAAAATVSLIPLSWLTGRNLQLSWLVKGLPATAGAAALFYSVSWISGVLLDDSLKAAAAGAAGCVAILAVGWFPPLQRISLSRHVTAARTMRTGAVDWSAVVVLILLSAAATAAAYRTYCGRDY